MLRKVDLKLLKKLAIKILPIIFSAGVLFSIVYYTEPPKTWNDATTLQILGFFVPLFVLVTSIVNLFVNYFPKSSIIGFATVILLTLKSINLLNLITLSVIILVTAGLFYFFKKPKFTRITKIPKLKHLKP